MHRLVVVDDNSSIAGPTTGEPSAVDRDRRLGGEVAVLRGGRRTVPSAEQDGVALGHQEAVAGIGGLGQVVASSRSLSWVKAGVAAAVVQFVPGPVVPFRPDDRPQDQDVGFVRDHAARVSRRKLEVRDDRVARVDGSTSPLARPTSFSY